MTKRRRHLSVGKTMREDRLGHDRLLFGKEHGIEALEYYTETKSLVVKCSS